MLDEVSTRNNLHIPARVAFLPGVCTVPWVLTSLPRPQSLSDMGAAAGGGGVTLVEFRYDLAMVVWC
jgi:hypothetical protein